MKYSFTHGLLKTLVNAAIFGLPVVLQFLPSDWLNLTVGGVLALTINYLKVKNKIANI